MLIVITGNGKGKTTSALGQALRAVGDGRKVLVVQFIKGPWKSGEDESCRRLEPDLRIIKTGLGFVGVQSDTLPRERHIQAARDGLELAEREAQTRNWDMVILDEVNNAVHLGLLAAADVTRFLDGLPEGVDAMLTGRDARQEFIDRADIVSEVKDIKHVYGQGVKGKKGIEW